MIQPFSFHNHTYRCMHAEPELTEERVVQEHANRGFTHVAVTDHCPWKTFTYSPNRRSKMLYEEKLAYLKAIRRAKEKYAGVISVYSGFETEHLPFLMDEILEMRRQADLMVLGQHFVYDPSTQDLVHVHDPSRSIGKMGLSNYAASIEDALRQGWPDIIAHPDVIMLQKEDWTAEAEDMAHRIFAAAAEADVPVEINLARIWHFFTGKLTKVEYPCRQFWQVAAQHDVKVLYGIDTHALNQLETFERNVKRANEILGEEILSKLHFCTAQEVLARRNLR